MEYRSNAFMCLRLYRPSDLSLRLSDTGKETEEYWGEISVTATLYPKTQEEKEHVSFEIGCKRNKNCREKAT